MTAQASGKTKRDILGRAIVVGFLLAVVFTALAHGAVEPWSVFVFEAIMLALVIIWAIKIIADKRFVITIPKTALPVAALALVGLAQSVAFEDGAGRWMSLSKNVEATRGAVTVLIFLLVAFVIAANFFVTRERLLALANFLVIYGLAMALFALVQHFTWNGKLFWLRPITVSVSPFGPYVNHNHFSGYMEMLIAVPIALIMTRAVSREMRLMCGFAAVVMGIAIVMSLSRGGMISLAAEMIFIVFVILMLARKRRQIAGESGGRKRFHLVASQALAAFFIAAIIIAGVYWIGSDAVITRVTKGQAVSAGAEKETFHSSRGWVWRDTLSMISANPLLGVGLGAYGTAFPIYSKSDGSLRVPQAHNDYLQVLADCGVVGGAIALWFLVVLFRTFAASIKSRDPLLSALALASGAGTFAILVHSVFDFNLQLPSNALLFLLLTAVASVVAAAPRDKENSLALRATALHKSEEVAASFVRRVSP